MLWTHPFLLAGLGALVVPVLIHLLMRAQGRKVLFSALRFLPQTKPSRERKKIRHWPLLFLRLLILAILVGAFARPFWPQAPGSTASRERARTIVLVLDRSASMLTQENGSTRWEAALVAAGQLFATMAADDRVAIVTFADKAEVITPWTSREMATRALTELKPTKEVGRLIDGLRVASTLLDRAPAESELVIISDLQKSSCAGIEAATLPIGTRCDIKQIGSGATENIAVKSIHTQSAGSSSLIVDCHNYSAQKRTGLDAICSLDHQPLFRGRVNFAANGTAHLTLASVTSTPGWHQLAVEVVSKDALAEDDRYFAGVFIPRAIPVLVAEPHLEKRNFARASYFLTSALSPEYTEDGSAPPPAGPFHLTVISADKLADGLALNPQPSVIVLPEPAEIPAGLEDALTTFVRSGGGLLVWAAAGTVAGDYNHLFGTLSPAHFVENETYLATTSGQGWRLGWWNHDSPLFGPVGESGEGDLTLPQFMHRVRLNPDPTTEVLASFADKTPFLLSRRIGEGRVLLVNASADTRQSDWPIHKTYLPMVQRMAYYLARRDPQAGFMMGPGMTPSLHAQINLGTTCANQTFLVVAPNAKPKTLRCDALGIAHDVDLETLGCYEIRNAQNEIQSIVAVNFPAGESDLAASRPEEISSAFHFTPATTSPFVAAGSLSARRELWPWLLAGLLPLLLLELTWANFTRP